MKLHLKPILATIATATLLAGLCGAAHAGEIHADMPEEVDPAKRHLIYLHGGWPETRPL